MKTTWKLMGLVTALSLSAIIFYACNKENSVNNSAVPAGKQNLTLFMTDGPGYFDKVLVDIRSVKVLVDTCSKKDRDGHWDDHHDRDTCDVWDSLSIHPGVYDLFTLRNGTDTLLAGGNVPAGKIIVIKIELGTHNSLVKDSVTYPLLLPPGTSPFIYITLRGDEWDEYLPGRLQLWMDFDISRSVIRVRDNMFYLRPFIKIFTHKASGEIEGRVLPKQAFTVITATSSNDTAYALPGWDGEYKMRGLKPGTYSVFFNASNGYKDTTITGVNVMLGKDTQLGTITLKK
jgi:hypothetical protein